MLAVVVDPAAGGRVSSLRADGIELLVTREQDPSPTGWGIFPMVPWAGRVRHGRLRVGDDVVELPTDLVPPHAIHGVGLTRAWEVDRDGSLALDLAGPGWPLGGTARQWIETAPDGRSVTLRMEVHNDTRSMPCEIGWHPWFRNPVTVRWNPQRMWRRDHEGIPDGTLVIPPPAGPWDDCFTEVPRPIELRVGDPQRPAVRLGLDSDCAHWVHFDALAHATCVEPQTGPPDAWNLGVGHRVEPGRPLRAWFRITQLPTGG